MGEDPATIVVDASVAIKWQLDDEECVSQALALRDDSYVRGVAKAVAPHLMAYEVANALATAVRQRRVVPEMAAKALENLLAVGVELREVGAVGILEIAMQHGISAYDAAYLRLAEETGNCPLWTGDRALYRAVGEKLQWVRWIGDYEPGRP